MPQKAEAPPPDGSLARIDSARARVLVDLLVPGVRVGTLVRLRWMAIAGQLLALLLIGLGFGFPIPWPEALAIVGVLAALNLRHSWDARRHDRIGGRAALVQLAIDLLQLAVLLFLTGGLSNPFSLLLLVPLTIAATLLSARETATLVLGALVLLVGLWFWHLPLPWLPGEELVLPPLFRFGILIAIGCGMLFLSFYAWQVSAEGRRRQAALVATQAALERETRMGALGSLAAAAAHELGGPLGTITLIARDLEKALANDPEFGPDVSLLNQEVRRSREILTGISERAEAEHPFPELALAALLREVIEPFEPTRVPVELTFGWQAGAGPVVTRTPELMHGLANLIGNALRHANQRVFVVAGETADELWVVVSDDGPGFGADLLPRLGEPFLGPSVSRSGSTGLGIFIATTLLGRTGGALQFGNRAEGGARVECRWRKADIEAVRERKREEGR